MCAHVSTIFFIQYKETIFNAYASQSSIEVQRLNYSMIDG